MGVLFGDHHSKVDYNLDYLHKTISSPEPRTVMVEIPAVNGALDLTDRLYRSDPVFGTREIELDFEMRSLREAWISEHSKIMRDLHGRRMHITLDEDPNFYWDGRVTVGEIEDHGASAGIHITAEVFPYKWARDLELVDMFNLLGEETYTFDVKDPIVQPVFDPGSSQENIVITYRGQTFISTGARRTPPGLLFKAGDGQEMTLDGTGRCDLYFRRGSL